MVTDPFEAIIAELEAERKRLDGLLDDAVAQYALVEEDMNARMKAATPTQLPGLMEERARIEDSLGIAELVERIDAVRARIAEMKARSAA